MSREATIYCEQKLSDDTDGFKMDGFKSPNRPL